MYQEKNFQPDSHAVKYRTTCTYTSQKSRIIHLKKNLDKNLYLINGQIEEFCNKTRSNSLHSIVLHAPKVFKGNLWAFSS